jgi:hypothetical protein
MIRSEKGFSIVTALVAAALVSGAVLTLNSAMMGSFLSGVKSRIVARQIALESALTAGLQDPAQFTSGVQSGMKAGNRPVGWDITYQGLTIATVGTPRYFTVEGQTCTAAEFGTKACLVGVELDVKCTTAYCAAAYRVAGSTSGAPTVATLGAPGIIGTAFVDPQDYSVPILYDLFMGKQASANCVPNTDLAVHGLNRDTGTVNCLKKPANPCGVGTFPKTEVFNTSTGTMELNCSAPALKLKCPSNYALYTFQPATLEAGASASGSCVFVGVDTLNWPAGLAPADAPSISGTFCPAFYNAQYNQPCQVVNQTPATYTCPTCTVSCAPCDAFGNCSSCTIGGEVLTNPLTCTQSVSGRTASAQITGTTYSSCTCVGGVSWSAKVHVNGRCDRAVPQTTAAVPQ